MKRSFLFFAFSILFVVLAFKKNTDVADGEGISFSKMTLQEAKQKALENDQLIFIDAYTTWCGPCKKMAATSFKDAEVGELFNEKFINLKIDCEEGEGIEFAKKYKIKAYPTLLIIDGEGKIVKSAIGSQSASALINFANSVD